MARFLEAATPLGEDLVLQRMSGHEELGRLPEFHLEFISRRRDIKPAQILGKNITWTLQLRAGGVRHFNGFVTRFAEGGEITTAAHEQGRKGQSFLYRAEVHPWLWFLTRTVELPHLPEHVRDRHHRRGVRDLRFADVKKMKLATCPKREFSVQYRETDFNFVSRLMEQEGIFYASSTATAATRWSSCLRPGARCARSPSTTGGRLPSTRTTSRPATRTGRSSRAST